MKRIVIMLTVLVGSSALAQDEEDRRRDAEAPCVGEGQQRGDDVLAQPGQLR